MGCDAPADVRGLALSETMPLASLKEKALHYAIGVADFLF
jgi:hypothetical protein